MIYFLLAVAEDKATQRCDLSAVYGVKRKGSLL